MKNFALFLSALTAFAAPSFSAGPGLSDLTPADIGAAAAPAPRKPAPAPPVTPPGVTIAAYVTDETFTFDSDAREALGARIEALRSAGITTLGGRVTRNQDRKYTFVIDYIPSVKHGAQFPPAVLVQTYRSGAAYWSPSDNEEAMNACAANFNSAGVAVLGSHEHKIGSNNSFAVDYLVKDLLRQTPEYDVRFDRYTGGNFTFESEAEDAVQSYAASLARAGVVVTRGRAVKRQDRGWSVQLEYPVRTNKYGARPAFSVSRYASRELFTFDSDALGAARERMAVFSGAGLPPVHAFAAKSGNRHAFTIDFIVRNIYQQGGAVPAAAVQTYQAAETFTFESEAEEALKAKAEAFGAAGLPVVGSAVTGSLNNYTYSVDYIAKAQVPAPPPHNF